MKRILIVEDEPITSLDLRKLLTQNGYEVVDRVFTGENAVISFNKHKPEIIIMDIHLKGKMNGIDAAKEIIQHSTPFFLFLTANGYEEYLKGTGIKYEYVRKPFSEVQIIQILKRIKDI